MNIKWRVHVIRAAGFDVMSGCMNILLVLLIANTHHCLWKHKYSLSRSSGLGASVTGCHQTTTMHLNLDNKVVLVTGE